MFMAGETGLRPVRERRRALFFVSVPYVLQNR